MQHLPRVFSGNLSIPTVTPRPVVQESRRFGEGYRGVVVGWVRVVGDRCIHTGTLLKSEPYFPPR